LIGSAEVYAQNQNRIDSLQGLLEASYLSTEERVDILNRLAGQYAESDSSQTVAHVEQALTLATKSGYTIGEADAYFQLAKLLQFRGHYDQAEETIQKSYELASGIGYQQGMAKAQGIKGNIQAFQGAFDQALVHFDSSAIHFAAARLDKGLANSYSNIAAVYGRWGEYQMAIKYLKKALDIAEDNQYYKEAGMAYTNISVIYYYLGDLATAIEYLQYAESSYKKIGNPRRLLALIYNNMGSYQKEIGQYEAAMASLRRANSMDRELGNRRREANSLNNLGGIFLETGYLDSALVYYERASQIHASLQDLPGLSYNLHSTGTVYRKLGDYAKAESYFLQSQEVQKQVGEKRSMGETLVELGLLYKETNRVPLAGVSLEKALRLGQEINSPGLIERAALHLSELSHSQGNHRKAYEYHILYKAACDTLLNQDQIEKISRLQTEFTFSRERDSIQFAHAKEKMAFEEEKALRQSEQKVTRVLLFSLTLLLLGLAAFFIYRHRQNAKLTKAYSTLEAAYEKITAINEEISTLNDSLETKVAQRTEQLQERNKKLEAYASYNSHVLRVPLARMLGLISVLQFQDYSEEEFNTLLQHLFSSSEELDTIVKDMQGILDKES